jgi:hypothetical protein
MMNTYNNRDKKQRKLDRECHTLLEDLADMEDMVVVVGTAIAMEVVVMVSMKVLIARVMVRIKGVAMVVMGMGIMLGGLECMVITAMANLLWISIKINRKIRNKRGRLSTNR